MPTRVPHNEVIRVINQCHRMGWRTKETRNGHVMVFPPNGGIITIGDSAKGWNHIMTALEKAGFNQLEEELRKVIPKPAEEDTPEVVVEAPASTKPRPMHGQLINFVREILRAHPEHTYDKNEMLAIVSTRYSSTVGAVYQSLWSLKKEGVASGAEGRYHWTDMMTPKPPTFNHSPVIPAKVETTETAGSQTGDLEIDEELKQLDEALVALAHIEAVVRKNRVVLKKFAELKKLLSGLNM